MIVHITETDYRRAELATAALAEVWPGRVRVTAVNIFGAVSYHTPSGRNDEIGPMRRKAIRLARLATDGPEYPTICDTHNLANNPERWSECRKVPVASALLGRTCGAP